MSKRRYYNNPLDISRILKAMPPPYLKQATPYIKPDFHHRVRELCDKENPDIDGNIRLAKVVILGDVGTGKTSIVNRFVRQCFTSNYKATIGVDFEMERFSVLGVPFNLQIWDTAGQERFRCIASSYYRGAHAAILVCDCTNLSTLAHAAQWLQDVQDANVGNSMVLLLAVNKKDMVSDSMFGLVEVRARQLCQSLGAEYWAVSAKTGECVDDLFRRASALVFNAAVLTELEPSSLESFKPIKIGGEVLASPNGTTNTSLLRQGCIESKCR